MSKTEQIVAEVNKSFVGEDRITRKVLIALLAGGHVLLEDIPGVGKTTLAVAFSKALGLSSKRIQFTPDIMPSDVTGFSLLRRDTGKMEYQPGAVMCNFLLADEINRASTRSQSALLEAMEENSVTVDGQTYELPRPFIVLATQNPTGSSGTQLLPDSQADRFMMCLSIGYPNEKNELEMLLRKHGKRETQPVQEVTNAAELLQMRSYASRVFVHKDIYAYILSLSRATRQHELVAQGASPRATTALMALSQASAYCAGRDFVVPQDVQGIYLDCMAHRVVLTPEAKRQQLAAKDVLVDIVKTTKAPSMKV